MKKKFSIFHNLRFAISQLPAKRDVYYSKGFSTIEVILAASLFVILTTGVAGTVIQGIGSNRLGVEQAVATQFATEGLDAVRSIKNRGFTNLQAVNSNTRGVTLVGGVWTFAADGTSNTLPHNATDNYIRTIKVEPVNRDAAPPNGNIVSSGGTLDPSTKKITSTVSWNYTSARPLSVILTTYLSDWETPITPTSVPTPSPTPTPTNSPGTNSFSGTVYLDANANGSRDTGEVGYQGATVGLSTSATDISDANGAYSFTSLPDGTYTVTLTVPAGYTSTTNSQKTSTLPPNDTKNFFIAPNATATSAPPTATPTSSSPMPGWLARKRITTQATRFPVPPSNFSIS